MPITVNVTGLLKTLTGVYSNVGGTLKTLSTVHANVNGALKLIHGALPSEISGEDGSIEGKIIATGIVIHSACKVSVTLTQSYVKSSGEMSLSVKEGNANSWTLIAGDSPADKNTYTGNITLNPGTYSFKLISWTLSSNHYPATTTAKYSITFSY